ncbi:hypothetical protein CB1_000753015 [Camelus ferus]|nr:hypothetical protein CB1_000753015 [Camelus ferus]
MAAAAPVASPGAPLSPKELLPKGNAEKPEEELEEEDGEELDETLSERLWSLTEMFLESIRKQRSIGPLVPRPLVVSHNVRWTERAPPRRDQKPGDLPESAGPLRGFFRAQTSLQG